jgi:hypothetical protein
MQPYSLIAVGGSGLWSLLHLVLRAQSEWDIGRSGEPEGTRVPDVVVLLDQCQADVTAILNALGSLPAAREMQVFTGAMSSPKGTDGRCAKHLTETEKVDRDPVEANSLSVLAHASMELRNELQKDTAAGFYAQPRLTSWWYELFGLDSPIRNDGNVKNVPFWVSALKAPQERRLSRTKELKITKLVVVGSLTGGTGAGLLPSVVSELSGLQDQLGGWRYELHVVGLLPWFALPPGFAGPPTADRLKANAVRGVQAMVDVFSRLSAHLGNAAVPAMPTTLSLVGGSDQLLPLQRAIKPGAKQDNSAVPDEIDFVMRRSVAPVFDVVSDAITHRMRSANVNQVITGEPRIAFYRSQGSTQMLEVGAPIVWNRTAAARVLAAHRAQLLADQAVFPLEHAAMLFGVSLGAFIQRPEGMGVVLGEILRGSLAGGARLSRVLLDECRKLLQERADETFKALGKLPDPAQSEPMQQLLAPSAVLKALDAAYSSRKRVNPNGKQGNKQGELLRLADTTRLDVATVRAKAPAVVDFLWHLLMGGAMSSTIQPLMASWDKQVWLPTSHARLTQAQGAVPVPIGLTGQADAGTEVIEFVIQHGGLLPQDLTDILDALRNSLGAAPNFDTEGWSEVMGHYQAIQHDLKAANIAQQVGSASWLRFREASRDLYVGLALGELTLRPIPHDAIQRLFRAKGLVEASEPMMVVDTQNPQWVVGLSVNTVGLVPSPRWMRREDGDAAILQLAGRISNHAGRRFALQAVQWFAAQKVVPQQPTSQVLQAVAGVAAGQAIDCPVDAQGYSMVLPSVIWPIDGQLLRLPVLAPPDLIATVARLASAPDVWSQAKLSIANTFVAPLASRPNLVVLRQTTPQLTAFSSRHEPVAPYRYMQTEPFQEAGW